MDIHVKIENPILYSLPNREKLVQVGGKKTKNQKNTLPIKKKVLTLHPIWHFMPLKILF